MKAIKFLEPNFPPVEECIEEWKKVYQNRQFTNSGYYANELELMIQNYLGVKHCVLVSNATIALMLAFKVFNLTGKVLIPSFTFAATASSLVWSNLQPKFVDVDDTLTMDLNDLEAKIDQDTTAIIPVNAFGNLCHIHEIEEIAKKHNLYLIFDSAAAFGADYFGTKLGKFGNLECFSFHSTKIFPIGEGGILTTNDDDIHSKLLLYRNFGIAHGNILCDGINAKVSEFNAAIGYVGMKYLEDNIKHHRLLAARYKQNLAGLVQFQETISNGTNQLFPIRIKNRDQVAKTLYVNGVNTRVYYSPLLNETVVYDKYEGKTPFAKQLMNEILCLPIYRSLTENDVDYICDLIKNKCI
jgi:dTDP-4-amino-4,6-dideoxygalactose transaminase